MQQPVSGHCESVDAVQMSRERERTFTVDGMPRAATPGAATTRVVIAKQSRANRVLMLMVVGDVEQFNLRRDCDAAAARAWLCGCFHQDPSFMPSTTTDQ